MQSNETHGRIRTNHFIPLACVAGLLFWIVDSYVDAFVFSEGHVDQQLFYPDAVEIYVRVFVWSVFLAFGIYAHIGLLKFRRVESALRESEERYRHLVDLSPDTILVHRKGNIAFINPAGVKLFGATRPEQVLGRSLLDFIHPDDVPVVKARMQRVRSGGRAERIEQTFRRLDGQTVEIEATAISVAYQNSPARLSVIRDVTERNRAQMALRKHEELLDLVINSVPMAIGYIDKTLHYQFVNRAFSNWFELSRTITQDKHMMEIIGTQAYCKLQPFIEQALTGQVASFEMLVPYQHGGERYVNTTYVPHRSQQGDALGYVAVVEDITQRKRAEAERRQLAEQLQQSQKMQAIGTLAGGIAHDFNNILTAILGYTELSLFDLPEDSTTRCNLQEILTASTRAKDLVNQILMFSRQGERRHEPMRPHLVVHEVLSLLRASLPATIDIRQHIQDDAGLILADATQLHRVLMNVCANAEHAMRKNGGVLEIRVEAMTVTQWFASLHPPLHPGPHVRLSIHDTGSGIAPDTVERIYEPFFTTKQVGEGTGMGLSVVHGIIADHQGVVTVQSTPGQGTTFDIYLPQIEASTAEKVPVAATMSSHQTGTLLVDDDVPLSQVHDDCLELPL